MKIKVMSAAVILVLCCAFMMSAASAEAGADDAAIDKVRTDFNAAFSNARIDALSQLIDNNAIWQPFRQPAITGKEKITAIYNDYFAKQRSKLDLKAGDIQSSSDLAIISGDFTRTDTSKRGGAAREYTGHYLFALKKQADGTWKIIRDIWSDNPVKPATKKSR